MKHSMKLINQQVKERAIEILLNVPIEPVHEVIIREYQCNRSLAQNRLFHKWMTDISGKYAEQTGTFHTSDKWKMYFKDLFLGSESVEINGRIVTRLISTSDLKVKPFTEFLEKIDHYCGSELQIILPRPEDLYREAMGM